MVNRTCAGSSKTAVWVGKSVKFILEAAVNMSANEDGIKKMSENQSGQLSPGLAHFVDL